MATLAKFTKQPVDVQDFDIDFTPYLTGFSDSLVSFTAEIETGATIQSSQRAGAVVKVWVAGGADGGQYKVTVVGTTAGGRTKSAEITIKVKEV